MVTEPVQYEMFNHDAQRLWLLHEQLLSEEIMKMRREIAHRPLSEIKEYIQNQLQYFREVDTRLTNVANSHPFYNVLAEKIGFFSRSLFGKLESKVNSIEYKDSLVAFSEAVALESIARTVQYFINNLNYPLLETEKNPAR
jgi:hypothetical protein